MVAPLAIARGTQNKILEAMAMGVPVITSRVAAVASDAEAGTHLLVAESPSEQVDAILRLLDQPQERLALSRAGRERMLSHHSWSQSIATDGRHRRAMSRRFPAPSGWRRERARRLGQHGQPPRGSCCSSTLFPSSVRPGHGIFVATRLRQLLATGAVEAKVVAPVPWFPFRHERFGDYSRMARTPAHEKGDGFEAWYPRYLLPPKIGMTVAPLALAIGAAPTLRRLIRRGFDFDVIDAHYYYPDGVAAALLARHFGKRLVITARGSDINLIAGHELPRRMMRWASKIADASIAVSRALALAMQATASHRPASRSFATAST
jgi:glycosyltransferase involved in cell wall biosynthesis